MRRHFVLLVLIALLGATTIAPQTVSACPMCKAATEQDKNQPKAYMYSILFMLGMPAVIFGAFGYGFYQMVRREKELESLPPLEETNESFSRG